MIGVYFSTVLQAKSDDTIMTVVAVVCAIGVVLLAMVIIAICISKYQILLAHLSRRLIGELLVYRGIRRPSVRPSSVVNIFKRLLL